MLDKLLRMLERKRDADPAERERVIRTATAALLVEMVRADSSVLGEEAAELNRVLGRHFGMSTEEVASLVSAAESEADAATSLYTFIKQLNGTLDASEKARVIELLWHVALSDEHLDRYEESLVRKVADLLKLSSSEVIRTKLLVQNALAKR
jgi:uncharacterized tellurite resistance protein B-like protein